MGFEKLAKRDRFYMESTQSTVKNRSLEVDNASISTKKQRGEEKR